jgi:hypothetical protein
MAAMGEEHPHPLLVLGVGVAVAIVLMLAGVSGYLGKALMVRLEHFLQKRG